MNQHSISKPSFALSFQPSPVKVFPVKVFPVPLVSSLTMASILEAVETAFLVVPPPSPQSKLLVQPLMKRVHLATFIWWSLVEASAQSSSCPFVLLSFLRVQRMELDWSTPYHWDDSLAQIIIFFFRLLLNPEQFVTLDGRYRVSTRYGIQSLLYLLSLGLTGLWQDWLQYPMCL